MELSKKTILSKKELKYSMKFQNKKKDFEFYYRCFLITLIPIIIGGYVSFYYYAQNLII
jgi:hypothetical protein